MRWLSGFLVLLSAVAMGPRVFAHPLGNFSLNHYNIVEMQPAGLLTQHVFDFAEIPSFNEFSQVDSDRDSVVSADELKAYMEATGSRFLDAVAVRLVRADGTPVGLEREALAPFVQLSTGQAGLSCIKVVLSAVHHLQQPLSAGTYTLVITDTFQPHVRGVQEVIPVPYEGVSIKVDATPDMISPRSTEEQPVYTGLDLAMAVTLDETVPAPDAEWQQTNYQALINPLSIPPFPMSPEPDGSYPIRSVPVEPREEVQNMISILQPRMVGGVTSAMAAMTGGSGPDSGQITPGVNPTLNPGQTAPEPHPEKEDDVWTNYIGADDLSPAVVAFILIASVFFGMGHALSPGHGKTVVAAYLVGTRGTVWHAIFLGIIVTFTHVFSVIVIGLITLYFQQYIMPETLYPILEGASGLLIIAIGIALFIQRFSAYVKATSMPTHAHAHSHSHDHSHDHSHSHDHGHDHKHSHDHDHDHTHSHDHSHDHAHDHDQDQDHGHHHHHHGIGSWLHHDHGPDDHTHEIPADATWRDLLVLGVTGGIVPCPSAVVVLVAAVAFGRLAFGLLMILFFSAGLAAVLILLGILVVKAKSLIDRFDGTGERLRWLQVASPVLVTILGFVILFNGLVSGGIIQVNL